MGKKLPHTPRSQVRSALRKLWLRSRERSSALQRTGNCCEACGVKQSTAQGRSIKLEVHHLDGIEWEHLIDYVYRHLLCHPDLLMPLCKPCHDKTHEVGTP
jgi:predicted HNH restriction endonuclease